MQTTSTMTIADRQQDMTYSMYRTQEPVWLHKLQKCSSQAQSRVALLLPHSTGQHHEEATAQDATTLQRNSAALMACSYHLHKAIQGIPNRMTVS
ncbi:MAG: hypothetical protein FRX49_06656 [Trebouxia sp. A1-2]|nr:MAG: hypothetical protein FRX49_06656 [Trebouxia sp. A1-2]